ncbi:MAG: ABC transporter substrate-binding protein, partial [Desulfovibrio sp.]|nr:ABC transporter substrate-binding protein [Desulfovibrio sp.]
MRLTTMLALLLSLLLAGKQLAVGPAQAADARSTLTLVRGGDSITLDPARANDSESTLVLDQICEGLVRMKDGSFQVEPALAESWTISPDGLAWTFRIRRGVSFHD